MAIPNGIDSGNRYLIRIGSDFYSRLTTDKRPIVSPYPSRGAHLDYETASQLCAHFQEQGHRDAVVTTMLGQPVDLQKLAVEQTKEDERFKKFWGSL